VAITQEIGKIGKKWVSNSAVKKVKWADNIVIVISASSLYLIYHKILEKINQINHQKIIHQANIEINIQAHEKYVHVVTNPHSNITHNITKNSATAVQSLNKLSHSKIRANLLGAQILLNIAKTATGSVADIRAQNNKSIINGILNQANENIKYNTVAIIIADIINQKIASHDITFQSLIICLYLILYEDSNNKTGRKTKNNISGVNLKSSINQKNAVFDNGTSKRPTITSNTV